MKKLFRQVRFSVLALLMMISPLGRSTHKGERIQYGEPAAAAKAKRRETLGFMIIMIADSSSWDWSSSKCNHVVVTPVVSLTQKGKKPSVANLVCQKRQ